MYHVAWLVEPGDEYGHRWIRSSGVPPLTHDANDARKYTEQEAKAVAEAFNLFKILGISSWIASERLWMDDPETR